MTSGTKRWLVSWQERGGGASKRFSIKSDAIKHVHHVVHGGADSAGLFSVTSTGGKLVYSCEPIIRGGKALDCRYFRGTEMSGVKRTRRRKRRRKSKARR